MKKSNLVRSGSPATVVVKNDKPWNLSNSFTYLLEDCELYYSRGCCSTVLVRDAEHLRTLIQPFSDVIPVKLVSLLSEILTERSLGEVDMSYLQQHIRVL